MPIARTVHADDARRRRRGKDDDHVRRRRSRARRSGHDVRRTRRCAAPRRGKRGSAASRSKRSTLDPRDGRASRTRTTCRACFCRTTSTCALADALGQRTRRFPQRSAHSSARGCRRSSAAGRGRAACRSAADSSRRRALTEETEAAGLVAAQDRAPLEAERGRSASFDVTRAPGPLTVTATLFRSRSLTIRLSSIGRRTHWRTLGEPTINSGRRSGRDVPARAVQHHRHLRVRALA